jgi:hypothetical protein
MEGRVLNVNCDCAPFVRESHFLCVFACSFDRAEREEVMEGGGCKKGGGAEPRFSHRRTKKDVFFVCRSAKVSQSNASIRDRK